IDKELVDSSNSIIFKAGLPINSKGLDVNNRIIQVVTLQLEESNIELKNTRKNLHESLETINKLHKQLEEISNLTSTNNSINSESLSCIFDELISKGKLGSSILVNTKVYLELIINKPCSVCSKKDIINYKYTIQVSELSICITIICFNCGTQTNHHNKVNSINFSKAISAAGLVRGINQEEVRTMLSFIGITCQSGIKQYFQHQDLFLNELVETANKNAEQNLRKIYKLI
ncbi:10951_t:CDS:2, partial [Racocetra fulgida]